MDSRRCLSLILAGVSLGVAGVLLAWPGAVTYWIAHWQNERLIAERPASRRELETRLWFSSSGTISCSESSWTTSYAGDAAVRCQRYLVLGREPIDVVYDREELVISIAASFE